MTVWFLTAVCSALFVELFSRGGVLRRARAVHAGFRKAMAVIASKRISDHWKERVVPRYARGMLAASLAMFAALLVALAPFGVAGWLAERADVPLFAFLGSIEGIAGACVAAFAWMALRNRGRGRARSSVTGGPGNSVPGIEV